MYEQYMPCIYLIRNTVNNKVYVGQTRNFVLRKAGHVYLAKKGSMRPLYASMRKHGIEKFTFEIIEECADEIVQEREKYWVLHFDSSNLEKGYNLTKGGEGTTGYHFTDKAKEKIRQKALQRTPYPPDVRLRQGSGKRGKSDLALAKRNSEKLGVRNHMFGRKGENHPSACLTQNQADEIRCRKNEPTKLLMKEFGVSKQTINRIKRNEIYVNSHSS